MLKRNFVIFTLFLLLIGGSGVAAGLGFRNLALWPWSHQWYMFSYSSDAIYKIRAVGFNEEVQIKQDIPLKTYFSYPANRYTNRADEVSRSHEHLQRFAAWLCIDNPHLTHIEINQARYIKQPGRIPDLGGPPDMVQALLRPTSCP